MDGDKVSGGHGGKTEAEIAVEIAKQNAINAAKNLNDFCNSLVAITNHAKEYKNECQWKHNESDNSISVVFYGKTSQEVSQITRHRYKQNFGIKLPNLINHVLESEVTKVANPQSPNQAFTCFLKISNPEAIKVIAIATEEKELKANKIENLIPTSKVKTHKSDDAKGTSADKSGAVKSDWEKKKESAMIAIIDYLDKEKKTFLSKVFGGFFYLYNVGKNRADNYKKLLFDARTEEEVNFILYALLASKDGKTLQKYVYAKISTDYNVAQTPGVKPPQKDLLNYLGNNIKNKLCSYRADDCDVDAKKIASEKNGKLLNEFNKVMMPTFLSKINSGKCPLKYSENGKIQDETIKNIVRTVKDLTSGDDGLKDQYLERINRSSSLNYRSS